MTALGRCVLRAIALGLVIAGGVILIAAVLGCATQPLPPGSDVVRANVFLPSCFMFCSAHSTASDSSPPPTNPPKGDAR